MSERHGGGGGARGRWCGSPAHRAPRCAKGRAMWARTVFAASARAVRFGSALPFGSRSWLRLTLPIADRNPSSCAGAPVSIGPDIRGRAVLVDQPIARPRPVMRRFVGDVARRIMPCRVDGDGARSRRSGLPCRPAPRHRRQASPWKASSRGARRRPCGTSCLVGPGSRRASRRRDPLLPDGGVAFVEAATRVAPTLWPGIGSRRAWCPPGRAGRAAPRRRLAACRRRARHRPGRGGSTAPGSAARRGSDQAVRLRQRQPLHRLRHPHPALEHQGPPARSCAPVAPSRAPRKIDPPPRRASRADRPSRPFVRSRPSKFRKPACRPAPADPPPPPRQADRPRSQPAAPARSPKLSSRHPAPLPLDGSVGPDGLFPCGRPPASDGAVVGRHGPTGRRAPPGGKARQ